MSYYIGFDMEGTPYIEHWGKDKVHYGKDSKHTKYVAKVVDGDTVRYFYSNNEYQKWLADRNKQKVSAYGEKARQVAKGIGNFKTRSHKSITSKKKDKTIIEHLRDNKGNLTSAGKLHYEAILNSGNKKRMDWDPKVTFKNK